MSSILVRFTALLWILVASLLLAGRHKNVEVIRIGGYSFHRPRLPRCSLINFPDRVSVWPVLGGRLGTKVSCTSRRRWLLTYSVFEAALLFAAAFLSIGFSTSSAIPPNRVYVVIVLIAVAMGLRTATVRRLGVPDLSTVVLTLTLAGLAADSSPAGGNNPRIRLRVAAVASMLAGAARGALLLRQGLPVPLVASAGCVLAVTAAYGTAICTEVIAETSGLHREPQTLRVSIRTGTRFRPTVGQRV